MTTPTNPDTELDNLQAEIHFKENSIPSIHAGKLTKATKSKLLQWSAKQDTHYKDNFTLIANAKLSAEWTEPVTGKKLYNEAAVAKRELEARKSELEAIEGDMLSSDSQWFNIGNRIATLNKELEEL